MDLHGHRTLGRVQVHGEHGRRGFVADLRLLGRFLLHLFRRRTAYKHRAAQEPPRPIHRHKYAMLKAASRWLSTTTLPGSTTATGTRNFTPRPSPSWSASCCLACPTVPASWTFAAAPGTWRAC